jgi:hypothetical protein
MRDLCIHALLVISSSKSEDKVQRKGKDADIAKWEADLRKSLANKSKQPATLTKQQQALVQVQLDKEAVIRQRVTVIASQLVRGLHLIDSLIQSNVAEFKPHISTVLQLLLDSALQRGRYLGADLAYDTYLVSPHLTCNSTVLTVLIP